jgi:hypothetical protein
LNFAKSEPDGPELSAREQCAIEIGHLLKVHYQRSWDAPVIDLSLEFQESDELMSDQFGLTSRRYGLLANFWGGKMQELDRVSSMFQSALNDYAWLLGLNKPTTGQRPKSKPASSG